MGHARGSNYGERLQHPSPGGQPNAYAGGTFHEAGLTQPGHAGRGGKKHCGRNLPGEG